MRRDRSRKSSDGLGSIGPSTLTHFASGTAPQSLPRLPQELRSRADCSTNVSPPLSSPPSTADNHNEGCGCQAAALRSITSAPGKQSVLVECSILLESPHAPQSLFRTG